MENYNFNAYLLYFSAESNNIYACGSNTDGQLGLDNVDMVNIPTKLQHNQFKENGIIKKLAAGSQHSAALTGT